MLIALCSVKGSPGVTTVTLALAAHWPDAENTRRLVAEVDPSGGDIAMRLGLPLTPGLATFAAAARRARDAAVVWEHTQTLASGARVLVAPPGDMHARAALHTLAGAPEGALLAAAAREPEVVVLADCGRVDPGSPAEAIARRAALLLLVTGTGIEALAHSAARLQDLARWAPRSGLLLTGDGYPTSDVERELGVPAIGRIPHDPAATAILNGRRPRRLRDRGGGLARATSALARTLAATPPAAGAVPPGRTPDGRAAVDATTDHRGLHIQPPAPVATHAPPRQPQPARKDGPT
ncbi:carbon monoxide dehydrogenase maturation protein [Amycolatopsis sp. cmx-4-68]|uniref:carbon monoxide dehydrogenase maturation protein n=1 Tax=Amycolatopsis sp. cmx-4-68 TaxID=2790938 RepID=UPI00397A7A4E